MSEPASLSDSKRIAERYTILDSIGEGGVGSVYRVRDEVTGRIVAYKQLFSAKLGKRAKTMEVLFEREYHTLVRLKHPRIIEVYDFGITPDGPYYTMELLEGSDLARLGRQPYAEVCRHLRDVASSLALLHAQRLVHRDVSPRNIRLVGDGTARLLDFGAVAPFGTNTEIIGTPPFMAPEILHHVPLDARTDLYSLGAVGYFCLTGRPAFPARQVHDLPKLWLSPPPPPSSLVAEIPPELDRLVLSMLSEEPLGRPETAAAVIDQLTIIGRLSPEPHERAEQSYFLSSPIVGRGNQMAWVQGRIQQALEGNGGEALIEGPAGIGKTRLANELCLSATLKGAFTLPVDAESTRARFGVAIELSQRLLEACPDVARRAAEPHAHLLGKLAPALAEALGGAAPERPVSDVAEYHAALREWFLAVSRERTLVVCVDNFQTADDDSASFVAGLGRDSRSSHLFVLATVRTGGQIGPSETMRVLRERAQRLKLPSLDASACESLASGLFGGAANAARVGDLLFQRSGGVPRQFIELAQLLVQKKIARYEGGSWVLPLQVADHELPSRSEEIQSARLSELGPDAIALAETLSIHAGTVPLATVLALSELSAEGRTYAVLDELIAEQVLMRDGDGYRFRHVGLREAVLSRMDDDTRRRTRLRAAEALMAAETSGVVERVEAALHLVEAGEERRGTRILVAAAREFSAGAGTHHDVDPLVRALCRMVRAYDEQGRSDYELGALLFPLLPLAYYSASWQFMLEYGERAVEIGIRITGLGRAAELAPELGAREALKRGLLDGAAGFTEHAAESIGYDLNAAVAATIGMVASCAAVSTTFFDRDAVERIVRAVEPLTFFDDEHVAQAMYRFAVVQAVLVGSESEARPLIEGSIARFKHPVVVKALGEPRAKALYCGYLFTLRLLDCYCFGDRALVGAREVEATGVRAWVVSADQLRLLYHSFRGESNEAKTYLERHEQNVVQGAQLWRHEVFWPALLLNADVLTFDAMAARRRHVQMQRRAQEAPSLEPQADAAHAAYLMLRGDLSGAIALYERVLPRFPCRRQVNWETTRAFFARALNLAGAHERAKAIAGEVLANMVPADEELVVRFLEARRQLALAESGLGNHERAAMLLDKLLAKHGHESNPLLVGLLHQARAEVAERAGEATLAEAHRAEMETRFRRTKNPLLIAQCERTQRAPGVFAAVPLPATLHQLAQNTVAAFRTSGEAAVTAATVQTAAATLAPSQLGDASSAEEPIAEALAVLMRQTNAKSAYLYALDGGALRLAWSSTNAEARAECVAELGRWLGVVRENERDARTRSERDTIPFQTIVNGGYHVMALRGGGDSTVIGGVILQAEGSVDLLGATELLGTLGRVLDEHVLDSLASLTF